MGTLLLRCGHGDALRLLLVSSCRPLAARRAAFRHHPTTRAGAGGGNPSSVVRARGGRHGRGRRVPQQMIEVDGGRRWVMVRSRVEAQEMALRSALRGLRANCGCVERREERESQQRRARLSGGEPQRRRKERSKLRAEALRLSAPRPPFPAFFPLHLFPVSSASTALQPHRRRHSTSSTPLTLTSTSSHLPSSSAHRCASPTAPLRLFPSTPSPRSLLQRSKPRTPVILSSRSRPVLSHLRFPPPPLRDGLRRRQRA